MLLKQKRFVNSKLDKIVELCKKEKNGKLTIEEAGLLKSIKVASKISIGKAIEGHMTKKYDKAYQKYDDRFSELDKMYDNKEISQEKYDKKIKNAEYKLAKAEYVLNMEDSEERPKNPTIQRAIENIKKGAKAVGKGLTTAAAVVGGVVASPFVIGYKVVKAVTNKVVAIGRGGKNLALTAGKVTVKGATAVAKKVEPAAKMVVQTVKETSQEVKETDNARRDMRAAEKSKELDDEATLSAKYDRFFSTSEQTQSAIRVKDWNAALKEDKKREREAARRENLHMDREEQHINHEEAMRRSEEGNDQAREEEQLEND